MCDEYTKKSANNLLCIFQFRIYRVYLVFRPSSWLVFDSAMPLVYKNYELRLNWHFQLQWRGNKSREWSSGLEGYLLASHPALKSDFWAKSNHPIPEGFMASLSISLLSKNPEPPWSTLSKNNPASSGVMPSKCAAATNSSRLRMPSLPTSIVSNAKRTFSSRFTRSFSLKVPEEMCGFK